MVKNPSGEWDLRMVANVPFNGKKVILQDIEIGDR
jgi:hypothetical protein